MISCSLPHPSLVRLFPVGLRFLCLPTAKMRTSRPLRNDVLALFAAPLPCASRIPPAAKNGLPLNHGRDPVLVVHLLVILPCTVTWPFLLASSIMTAEERRSIAANSANNGYRRSTFDVALRIAVSCIANGSQGNQWPHRSSTTNRSSSQPSETQAATEPAPSFHIQPNCRRVVAPVNRSSQFQ